MDDNSLIREIRRFILAKISLGQNDHFDELKKKYDSDDSLKAAHPTRESLNGFLTSLKERVLTEDLLEDHNRLQSILFPEIVDELDRKAQERGASYYLQLFTYPELLASTAPTKKERSELLANIQKEIDSRKASREANRKLWSTKVRELIRPDNFKQP